MNTASVVLLVGICMAFAGCATITTGTTDVVRISSVPDGATVELDGRTYQTPVSLTLSRDRSYDVVIRKDGYLPAHRVIARVGNAASTGNLLIGGLAGIVADQSTGAAFRLFPTDLTVELVPATGPAERVYESVR